MSKLADALKDLLDQVESLDDFTLTRDAEPYKAQACWDDAIRNAHDALRAAEQPSRDAVLDEAYRAAYDAMRHGTMNYKALEAICALKSQSTKPAAVAVYGPVKQHPDGTLYREGSSTGAVMEAQPSEPAATPGQAPVTDIRKFRKSDLYDPLTKAGTLYLGSNVYLVEAALCAQFECGLAAANRRYGSTLDDALRKSAAYNEVIERAEEVEADLEEQHQALMAIAKLLEMEAKNGTA